MSGGDYVEILSKSGGSLSPLEVSNFVANTIGEVQMTKILRSGNALVLTNTKIQTEKLLTTDSDSLKIRLKDNLNMAKGVIKSTNFKYETDATLLKELQQSGVKMIQRILRKGEPEGDECGVKEGLCNTGHLILTFEARDKPDFVVYGSEKLNVNNYYPRPMRCAKCFRYGHPTTRCSTLRCGKCGSGEHIASNCDSKTCCPNCSGEHCAWSPLCPVYIKEKQIARYMVDNKCTYYEAKNIINPKTYATVLGQKRNETDTTEQLLRYILKTLEIQQKQIAELNQKVDGIMSAHKETVEHEQEKLQPLDKPSHLILEVTQKMTEQQLTIDNLEKKFKLFEQKGKNEPKKNSIASTTEKNIYQTRKNNLSKQRP